MPVIPVIIYTDGACSGNPGAGGWGALVIEDGKETPLHGGEKMTTNNRMELSAAINALGFLGRHPHEITLVTDSTYVKDGLTKWLPNWKKKGWRTADNKPVKNQDLWQRLDELASYHKITWHWVKGHSGNPDNERVDGLARLGVEENR